MTVSRATLSLQIDEHLAELGFDTKKLATGEYILQRFSKKWDQFVDVKLGDIVSNDVITVTPVTVDIQTENKVSNLTIVVCFH
jgi:hypothetical protein